MKKRLYVLLISLLMMCSCAHENPFDAYRYNPFIYPYPEHRLKAEADVISSIEDKQHEYTNIIEFYGYKANLPLNLFDSNPAEKNDGKIIYKKDKKVLIIHREKDTLLGCTNADIKDKNKDFCSAFASTKDFYHKLFTLTPDDLHKSEYSGTGNKWIVHRKGFFFENVTKIKIYSGADFIAFESTYTSDRIMTKEIILFPEKTHPYYFTLSTNVQDANLFRTILETMRE